LLKRTSTNSQNENVILDIVRTHKPQTTEQLIKIAKEQTDLGEREITALVIQMENEDKLKLTLQQDAANSNFEFVLLSKNVAWYWVTVTFAIATAFIIFFIPTDLYPAVYIRQIFGLVFILFLPGYTFMKMLFPHRVPFKTNSENMDAVERIILSLSLSLSLTPIVGLILYYTPLGFGIAAITLSLLTLTLILGTTALMREYLAAVSRKIRNSPI